MSRALFEEALAHLTKTMERHRQEREAIITEYDAARLAEARTHFPRRKDPVAAWVKADREGAERWAEPWRARGKDAADRWRAEVDALEAALTSFAPAAEIHPGEPRLFDTIWTTTYSSQGFGAEGYARGAAEGRADVARHAGVGAEVRRVERDVPASNLLRTFLRTSKLVDYEVWVSVSSDVDMEILRRRPGPTMREWVRLCWKRGVNPRVLNPFLPHGYEERAGLDYHGGEVAPRT